MKVFIIKSILRFLAIVGLAAILPFAASNPAVDNQWLIWIIGAILALYIAINEPSMPSDN